jgi:DNA topoisomerase IA/ssDNA-binding Zn-finger/Zn-ribbon topoisomerase 1
MAKCLFLVENSIKAEQIKLLSGGMIDVVVLEGIPASYSLKPQNQSEGSVFSFTPVSAVWNPVIECLSGYNDIYYSFDTSMEGEYVSFLVDQLLLTSSIQSHGHRLNVAGFTKDILSACVNFVEPLQKSRCLAHLYHHLFHTVFFSHLSRLLGTTHGPGHIKLSMTTLTLLTILAEKHESLKQMVRRPKWEIDVRFQQDDQDASGRLVEIYGVTTDGFLESGEQAKEIADSLKNMKFSIVDRSEKELVFASPQLYTLPELVCDAYQFYHMHPGDVLAGLQDLFTGMAFGQGKTGLISSPYGVSSASMEPVFGRLTQFVQDVYGKDAQVKNEIGDGVILPLNPALRPEDVQLSPVHQRLYGLIWAKSVASQMADAVGSDKKVLFEAAGKRIQFSSLTLVQKGFLAVFKHGYESVFTEEDALLFQEGDTVVVTAALLRQSQSQGLSHYQIASLCEDMREMGFDDEKMIFSVLQQMLDHHYILLSSTGEIMCTETLLKVTSTIDRAFPGMKGMNLVAYYGQTVEEVMSGRKRVDVALKQFDQNLIMQGKPLVKVKVPAAVSRIKRKSKNVIKGGQGAVSPIESLAEGFENFGTETDDPPVEECCDEAEESIVSEESVVEEEQQVENKIDVESEIELETEAEIEPEIASESDVLLSAETPVEAVVSAEEESVEVDSSVEMEAEPVHEAVFEQSPDLAEESAESINNNNESDKLSGVETKECPECGRPMVVKDDRFGKFWACTGMPACHHSETYHKQKEFVQAQSCPVCKRGHLSVNRTAAGKDMYICSDAACEFVAWSKPHAIDCPLCGSPFLIQKKDRSGNVNLRCPVAGCSYVHGALAEDAIKAGPKKKMVRVRRKKTGGAGGKKRRVVRRRKK